MGASGSIRELNIQSRPFSITADSGGNIAASSETTSTKTSGGSINSIELQVPRADDIKVDVTNAEDYTFLAALSESGEAVPVSMRTVAGDVYSSEAAVISVGQNSLKDGMCEVMIDPSDNWIIT